MNIIGRVTKDAEVRTTQQDKRVVSFSVAINDSYRNKQGERVEQTTYFDCSYWLSANVAKLLTKGSLVELTGRVSARAWTGKDGKPRSGLNFHTAQIKLHSISRKHEPDTIAQPIQTNTNKQPDGFVPQKAEDDLPF